MATKNTMEDMRNHAFEALERLNDPEMTDTPEKLEIELKKAKAVAELGKVIVESGKAEIMFIKVSAETGNVGTKFMPSQQQLLEEKKS
jgi:hypothetical protein